MSSRLLLLLRWLPALGWMSVIFYWSSQSTLPIDQQPRTDDLHRVAHVIAYAILALLLALAIGTTRRHLLLALVLVALYGLSDELHQSFVPGRQGRPQDAALDVVAAAAALGMFVLLRAWLLERLSPRSEPLEPLNRTSTHRSP